MPEELENSASSSPMTVPNARSASGEAAGVSAASATVGAKKKRNLPGMPDPNAEVIALSPKTLMATNRFVCEICNKGFQRDQNLQLHRRGHNLPWKLRQRSGTEPRKRVYVCPEPSCVHHDPWRALGDLTGIKKHFCRKHGEKKWKCEKCSKKYAVQSDWKAHSKTCGTKEYRCDCGTLFSRKDSFITHRAFCDALAVESAKSHTPPAPAPAPVPAPAPSAAAPPATAMINSKTAEEEPKLQIDAAVASSSPSSSSTSSSSSGVVSMALPVEQQERDNPTVVSHQTTPTSAVGSSNINGGSSSCNSSVFAGLFASTVHAGRSLPEQNSTFSGGLMETLTPSDHATNAAVTVTEESTLLCLSSYGSTLFSPPQDRRQFAPPTPSHMSATALLQKAAQMGVTASNGSLLRALGLSSSSPPESSIQKQENLPWQQQIETPNAMAGLGLGLPYGGDLLPGELMLFDVKPATVDFLGLGMGGGGAGGGGGGFSELMSSIGGAGGLDDMAGSFGGDSRGRTH